MQRAWPTVLFGSLSKPKRRFKALLGSCFGSGGGSVKKRHSPSNYLRGSGKRWPASNRSRGKQRVICFSPGTLPLVGWLMCHVFDSMLLYFVASHSRTFTRECPPTEGVQLPEDCTHHTQSKWQQGCTGWVCSSPPPPPPQPSVLLHLDDTHQPTSGSLPQPSPRQKERRRQERNQRPTLNFRICLFGGKTDICSGVSNLTLLVREWD